MIGVFKNYLFEPKSKIGWVHGILTIIGACSLAFLTMMLYSKFALGDYGMKILPAMMLTPIAITLYSLWLLFSIHLAQVLKKVFVLALFLSIVLKVF